MTILRNNLTIIIVFLSYYLLDKCKNVIILNIKMNVFNTYDI